MLFEAPSPMLTRLHLALALLLCAASLPAQKTFPDGHLDPTRSLPAAAKPSHTPLPEQYLWTAADVTTLRPHHNKFPWNRPDLRIAPHYFRAHFNLASVPVAATFYIAGPRQAHVYLNGQRLADFNSNIDAPINFHVFHAEAAHALKPGENTIAIEAIRGRGVVAATDSVVTPQLAYGEVLAAKIIPAAFGIEAPPLLITDQSWRSTTTPAEHWQDSTFDDHAWPAAASLGPIEGNVDLFQWNADAGMYAWPGYMGMSSALRTFALQPQTVSHLYAAHAQIENLSTLTETSAQTSTHPFTITLSGTPTDAEAPSLLLDFGREVAGRLLVESACDCTATLAIAYGESEIEALSTGIATGQQGGNYLGTNLLEVPPHGIARGPKSGFRYVRIAFLRGAPITAFKSIRLEGIYYPVTYRGTFESSDTELNRIWEAAAYTAHLAMQDGIWDAPKRDRGRWVGDLDVAGSVISTVFADPALTEDTLSRLADNPSSSPINNIPSYSALWITTLYDLNQHADDKPFIIAQRKNLLRILANMDATLNSNAIFTNTKHRWLFVDWAPGLYAYTPEANIGTQLQYLRAYSDATSLLTELGDTANAAKYKALTVKATAATQEAFRDPNTGTYGATWQLNALAVLTDPSSDSAIWNQVLSRVKQDAPADQTISPYFNTYLLDAMSATNHPQQALDWLRKYWGGMLAEGATSFWESYDLRWPKTNPHLSLQADGTSGYFVSLAHAWSSGPAAWLAENVLGVTPTSPGYRTVDIHPNLLGLAWARGTVPTPHGDIKIGIDQKGITLDLPAGIDQARILPPTPAATVFLNGAETRLTGGYLVLTSPGRYAVLFRNLPQ